MCVDDTDNLCPAPSTRDACVPADRTQPYHRTQSCAGRRSSKHQVIIHHVNVIQLRNLMGRNTRIYTQTASPTILDINSNLRRPNNHRSRRVLLLVPDQLIHRRRNKASHALVRQLHALLRHGRRRRLPIRCLLRLRLIANLRILKLRPRELTDRVKNPAVPSAPAQVPIELLLNLLLRSGGSAAAHTCSSQTQACNNRTALRGVHNRLMNRVHVRAISAFHGRGSHFHTK